MSKEVKNGYKNKLKNQLYIALCEREKNGTWRECVDSLQIELMGLLNNYESIGLYILTSKIGALKFLNYEYFRKTIFDCMELVDKYIGD